jgi:hypothetical protein
MNRARTFALVAALLSIVAHSMNAQGIQNPCEVGGCE